MEERSVSRSVFVMVGFLVYCIRVSTDQIEDPKQQKGAEHGAEAHAQQECGREHKHDDVPMMP